MTISNNIEDSCIYKYSDKRQAKATLNVDYGRKFLNNWIENQCKIHGVIC